MKKKQITLIHLVLCLLVLAAGLHQPGAAQSSTTIYLPIVQKPDLPPVPLSTSPVVNVPYFSGEVRYPETAIFWFGRVKNEENYADVRLGYNSEGLQVIVAVFDRRMWYDTTPQAADFPSWDSASIFLSLDGQEGSSVDQNSYRFDAQLYWYEDPQDYMFSYRGNGTGWSEVSVPFTADAGYRGSHNDGVDDRGWAMAYTIPFSSLGISEPAEGSLWGLGVRLYDRDDEFAAPLAPKQWPENMNSSVPSTWGGLRFGMPDYNAPAVANPTTVTIRQGLNGAVVTDGEVGGGTLCGHGMDYWNEWGDFVNPGGQDNSDYNVQNQSDIADWPCYSKVYLTFPLDQIPPGMAIVSATLVMHQMGGSGGGDWGNPGPSYIQVFTLQDGWQESTLTWNNAPQAWENVSGAWVPWTEFPGWPGTPREWNLSLGAAQAYIQGTDLKLALYMADNQYHSGKYFVSSETGDWNAIARPTLLVTYGYP